MKNKLSFYWLKLKIFFGWRPKIKRREYSGTITITKAEIEKAQKEWEGKNASHNR